MKAETVRLDAQQCFDHARKFLLGRLRFETELELSYKMRDVYE
jgi:hypothetical protein